MTVRAKLETSDTGAGSPVTVTTPPGFQGLADSRIINGYKSPSSTTFVEYVMLDGNGTDWEYGLGYQSGTLFYRSQVLESTNTDAAIVLSVGTHTILFPSGGLNGRLASVRFVGTVAVGAASFGGFSWTGYDNAIDNVYDMPGNTAPTLPATYPVSGVNYFKGAKFHLYAEFDTVDAGEFIQVFGINQNLYAWPGFSMIIPCDSTSFTGTCSSSMLSLVPPFGSSPSYGGSLGDWEFQVNNPGAAKTVDAILTVDFYL